MDHPVVIRITDFAAPAGWGTAADVSERARRYCERLEAGDILCFRDLPFALPEDDRRFLLEQHWGGSALHKNISYRPSQDLLRGYDGDATERTALHRILKNYSAQVVEFARRFLIPYADRWSLDFASFRPLEEEGRDLPLHKRNDLLHVDAFPSRPTRGGRILRVFTNLNPSKPRVWLTTNRFPELAQSYAREAGLDPFAIGASAGARFIEPFKRLLHLPGAGRSAYDRFMLRFHDYMKENEAFQSGCERIRLEFEPLSTWLVFTDGVPHAVLSGQYALEQTFIIPTTALVAPQMAPIRVLESLCGRSLEN